MAAPRWASFERSCDQYGIKLRADHGGSTPGGVLVGARGAPPALEQAKHLRRGPPEHFEHTRDNVVAVGSGRSVLLRHLRALRGARVGEGGVRARLPRAIGVGGDGAERNAGVLTF